MISAKILRVLAVPGSCGIIVYAKEIQEKGKDDSDEPKKLVKPSELPLYSPPPNPVLSRNESQPSILYSTVSSARQELTAILKQGEVVRSEIEDGICEVLKEGQDVINYLREEENLVPRGCAIAIGGLTGYISGLRKGIIRRLFRTGLGAGVMAAICYPREAREYSQDAFREAKKYLIIAYHFVNGDEIDYEKIERQIKEEPLFFPKKKSLDEPVKVNEQTVRKDDPLQTAKPKVTEGKSLPPTVEPPKKKKTRSDKVRAAPISPCRCVHHK